MCQPPPLDSLLALQGHCFWSCLLRGVTARACSAFSVWWADVQMRREEGVARAAAGAVALLWRRLCYSADMFARLLERPEAAAEARHRRALSL